MIEMARKVYDKIDLDGSGSITSDEIMVLAGRMGKRLEAAALQAAMAELDADESGEVDFAEFAAWWSKWAKRQTSQKNRAGLDGVLFGVVRASPP